MNEYATQQSQKLPEQCEQTWRALMAPRAGPRPLSNYREGSYHSLKPGEGLCGQRPRAEPETSRVHLCLKGNLSDIYYLKVKSYPGEQRSSFPGGGVQAGGWGSCCTPPLTYLTLSSQPALTGQQLA